MDEEAASLNAAGNPQNAVLRTLLRFKGIPDSSSMTDFPLTSESIKAAVITDAPYDASTTSTITTATNNNNNSFTFEDYDFAINLKPTCSDITLSS